LYWRNTLELSILERHLPKKTDRPVIQASITEIGCRDPNIHGIHDKLRQQCLPLSNRDACVSDCLHIATNVRKQSSPLLPTVFFVSDPVLRHLLPLVRIAPCDLGRQREPPAVCPELDHGCDRRDKGERDTGHPEAHRQRLVTRKFAARASMICLTSTELYAGDILFVIPQETNRSQPK